MHTIFNVLLDPLFGKYVSRRVGLELDPFLFILGTVKRKFPSLLLAVVLPQLLALSQRSSERKFSGQVDQARLIQTVRELVSFGNRLGGTKSGDKASRYVLEKFRSFGYKAGLSEDPEKLVFTHERWSLHVEKPSGLRNLIRNEWLAGFSPSAASKRTKLVLVASEEDFPSASVESSAVLVPAIVSHDVYTRLVNAGAVCVLSYDSILVGYKSWSLITELSPSNENRIPLFNISFQNGERLKQELRRGKDVTIRFSAKTSIRRGRPRTVVATLKGKSDDCYIVCAHGDSDSGGPGADDNASGVAGVMELARVMRDLVARKAIRVPAQSVKFIVWGSEYFSTEHYVRAHEQELGKILGVVNYDEIGTGKTRNCLYFEGNDIPQNERFLRVFEKVGEDYVGKRGFWHEATTNPSQGGTDSYVFLPEYLSKISAPSVEIPAITVYSAAWNVPKTMLQTPGWSSRAWKGHQDSVTIDYSAYYHSSMDIPATTTDKEPFNMVWAVKAVGIGLLRLAW